MTGFMGVHKTDFEDSVFADDLNCTRICPSATTNAEAVAFAKRCQDELNKWGRANQIVFDK